MIRYIVLAAAAVIIGIFMAMKKKDDVQAVSLRLTAAFSVAIAILVFPYHLKLSDLPIAVIETIRSGLSGIAMGADGSIPYELEMDRNTFLVYRFFLYSLYVLGPLVGSLFLFSFSTSVRTLLSFIGKKKFVVFSELNEHSIAIAESLKESDPSAKSIFCNTLEPAQSLKDRTVRIKALTLRLNEKEIRLMKDRKYEFFQIADDEEKRIRTAAALCESLIRQKNYKIGNVVVRVLAGDRQRELILNLDRQYGDKIYLRHIDEDNALARSVLCSCSDLLAVKKDIKVSVLTDEKAALDLVKMMTWLLVKPNGSYRIRLIGEEAGYLYEELLAKAPEIKNYPIEVKEVADGQEVRTVGRGEDIVFVMYGDDGKSYERAVQLRRYLSFRSPDLSHPLIYCHVADPSLNRIIKEKDIILFGDLSTVNDYERLVSPQLEEAAKRVHLSYLSSLGEKIEDEQKLLEESGFYRYQNQESSFAEALALTYKKKYILSFNRKMEEKTFVKKWLADEKHLQQMAIAEHERWNAYQRVHGWRTASKAQTEAIIRKYDGKRANDPELKLHPAIVDYKDLEAAEKMVNSLFEKQGSSKRVHYLEADRVLIEKLIYILDGTEK